MKPTLPIVTRAGHFVSEKLIPGATSTAPRVVQTYELEMFTEDSGTAYINGMECPIKKGCIMMAKPGDVRFSKLHVRCYFIHFTTEDLQVIRLVESLPTFFLCDHYDTYEGMFNGVYNAFISADSFAPMAAASRVIEFLWHLHMHSVPSSVVSSRDPVRLAKRMINRDFREDISVEQLAAKCNLSVSYFHKLFVQRTGTTPNRYLMLTRITAAKTMLLTSNQSIAQIAESCGFSSQGYFCDCMKKYTGMSPMQFRRTANYPEEA